MDENTKLFPYLKENLGEKNKRKKMKEEFEPKLKQIGAIFVQNGIWKLENWFLYPSKGFAMNKFDTTERISLYKFIKDRGENVKC